MFRSNRGYILALGLIYLAFGLGTWFLMPGAPQLPTYDQREAYQSANHPGGPGCKAQRLASLSGDQALSELDRCTQAAQQQQHDARDLIQQTRAADAAQASASLGYQTLILTWLGAVFGFGTLLTAIAAVWFAKRAADAAEKSIGLALETSRAELRAYLGPISETFVMDEGSETQGSATIVLTNRGATPAHSADFRYERQIEHTNGGVDRLGAGGFAYGTIAKDDPVRVVIPFHIGTDGLRAIKARKAKWVAELRITYRDTFGEVWVYEHKLIADATTITANGPLTTEFYRQYQQPERKDHEADKTGQLPF